MAKFFNPSPGPKEITQSSFPRIFTPKENIKKETILICGETLRKVRRVLRLKPGDILSVFDGSGMEYLAQIINLNSNAGELKIIKKITPQRESPLIVHIGQALPKANKMELIIQKSVELGVFEIHPFYSSRTIPRSDSESIEKKLKRWQKISQEAAQQSGRIYVPRINPPVDFSQILQLPPKGSLALILQKGSPSLKELFQKNHQPSAVFFLVGPEGGFSEEEVSLALTYGFKPISLGERILRTETVALTFLSIIQYEWGDIG